MGEKPSSVDACAYGFLANIIKAPGNSPLQAITRSYTHLVAYCEKMHKQFYILLEQP